MKEVMIKKHFFVIRETSLKKTRKEEKKTLLNSYTIRMRTILLEFAKVMLRLTLNCTNTNLDELSRTLTNYILFLFI